MSKILKNTVIYSVGQVLPQAIGFLLLPLYIRYLSPTDYGILASMQLLQVIICIFLTLSMDRAIYRLYYDYKTENERKFFVGSLFCSIVIISSFVTAMLFICGSWLQKVFESISFHPYYTYMILTSYLSVFSYLPLAVLMIREKAMHYIAITLSKFILDTVLQVYFITVAQRGAEGQLFATFISGAFYLFVYLWVQHKYIIYKLDFTILRPVLSFALPILPNLLASWILNLSDRIFIEKNFSLAEVGIYSLSSKLASIIVILSGGFLSAYTPVFYRVAAEETRMHGDNILSEYNMIHVGILLLSGTFVSIFSAEIVSFLGNVAYGETRYILPLLAVANIISQGTGVYNLCIYQAKKSYYVMYITFVVALFSVGSNYFLIPKFGVYGAAVGAILVAAGMFVLTYWFAQKSYFVDISWGKGRKVLFLAILIVIVCGMLDQMSEGLRWLVKISMYACFFYIILIHCFKLENSIEKLKSIWRKQKS